MRSEMFISVPAPLVNPLYSYARRFYSCISAVNLLSSRVSYNLVIAGAIAINLTFPTWGLLFIPSLLRATNLVDFMYFGGSVIAH